MPGFSSVFIRVHPWLPPVRDRALAIKLNHGLHLAYCTNVHRGETWAQTFDTLERHTLVVRRRIAAGRSYAIGLRLGVNRTWDSRWFAAGADYSRLLHQDLKLREWLRERLAAAGVSRIIIERPHKKCRITIYAARPGVVTPVLPWALEQ